MELKFERMRSKFLKLKLTLISALRKKITEKEADLDSLKTHFILRDPDHEQQFIEAQSVDELLRVVLKDCYFTNPKVLANFAFEFDLPEVEEEVGRYWDDLMDYYDQLLDEDFVKKGLEQYDKNANIEVSIDLQVVQVCQNHLDISALKLFNNNTSFNMPIFLCSGVFV